MNLRSLPTRKKNIHYRSREHLTLAEVNKIVAAAGSRGRYPDCDRALLLMVFRHGFRAGEICNLKWDAVKCWMREPFGLIA